MSHPATPEFTAGGGGSLGVPGSAASGLSVGGGGGLGGGLRKQASRVNYHSEATTPTAGQQQQQHQQQQPQQIPQAPGIPVITPPDDDIKKGLGDEDHMNGMDETQDESTMRATTPQALLIAEANELERQYELAKASGLRRKTILLDLKDPDAPLSRLMNGGSNGSEYFVKPDSAGGGLGAAAVGEGGGGGGGTAGSGGAGAGFGNSIGNSARSTPGAAGGGLSSRRMSLGVAGGSFVAGSATPLSRRKSALVLGDVTSSAMNIAATSNASLMDLGGGGGMKQKRQASVSFADLPPKGETPPVLHQPSHQPHHQNSGLGVGGVPEMKKNGSNLMLSSISRQVSGLGSGGLRTDSINGGGLMGQRLGGSKRNSSVNLASNSHLANQTTAISTTIVNAKVPTGPNQEVLARARALCRDRNADVKAMLGTYNPWPILWPSVKEEKEMRTRKGRPMKDEWERSDKNRFTNYGRNKLGPGCYDPHPRIIAPALPECTAFKSTVPRFLVDEAELEEFSGIGPGTYAVEVQETRDTSIPWIKAVIPRLGRIMESSPKIQIGTDMGLIEKIGDVKVTQFTGSRKMNGETDKKTIEASTRSKSATATTGKANAHHPLDMFYFVKGPIQP
ncbi:hypothetical protein BDR26DRAFT_850174 [Obelidium mucronatum]|nr:hypothetical protein BDR26DRAFT_850174 [Obelidium mucronatum]